VLDRVQLQLKRGEFLYIVGGSGAGKSSLLRLLALEEEVSSGDASLFGIVLKQATENQREALKRSIGYIPQSPQLLPDLTVMENLMLALGAGAVARRLDPKEPQAFRELVERIGLKQKLHHSAGSLSGGEAQRVMVARALIKQPELILADEPTGAQDKDYIWILMDLFLRANLKGATVVLATHDREVFRRVRKRCAALQNGKLSVEEGNALWSL
jgi:cell division transport system ATP-binding protein